MKLKTSLSTQVVQHNVI